MSPRQRFEAAMRMEEVDRPPLFYQHLGASSHLQRATGLQVRDGFQDPEVFTRLSMEAYRQFGFDNVMAGWGGILVEAHAHGSKWKFTDPRFYPRPDGYVPIDRVPEIEPVDPLKDEFWSVPVRAAQVMVDAIGKEIAVVGCINSPW
jgi:uroporphyrinogen-III decarboxylase